MEPGTSVSQYLHLRGSGCYECNAGTEAPVSAFLIADWRSLFTVVPGGSCGPPGTDLIFGRVLLGGRDDGAG